MSSGLRGGASRGAVAPAGDRYKWVALSNTTLALLIASIDMTIVTIAMPDIFRGIHLNPLDPANTAYLLWMILGFSIVTSVLVVSLGRLGDMYGRVRVYNCGFAVFTVFSVLLSITWLQGADGARWLVLMRVGQGLGAAMLFANSSAILTDAFPPHQRGRALGINMVAYVLGSSMGLVLGGLLAPVSWRLVFLVSVPAGAFGTAWAYLKLKDIGEHHAARIDWQGNLTFALGLGLIMVAISTGIQPYGHHTMGWTSPWVLSEFAGGAILLAIFCKIETRVAEPMFHFALLRVRAFTAGNIAGLLGSLARGGLQLTLIIWLQGIWLPEHGYSFSSTPFWAGISVLPLILGMLVTGPVSGWLSDRFGARPFTTGGMLLAAATFLVLERLPVDFPYAIFALLLFVSGIAVGLFGSPNRAAVMNSLPPSRRGVGGGMQVAAQNSGALLSTGIFFSLMIIGFSRRLPQTLQAGLLAHGVSHAVAVHASHVSPASTLFAMFLGYNPATSLLGTQVLHALPRAQAAIITGHSFFPHLASPPFSDALHAAFTFAFVCCLVSAAASFTRGGRAAVAELPAEPVALTAPEMPTL